MGVALMTLVWPSKHRQPAATPTAREGDIDPRDLGPRQLYIGRAGILFDMLDAGPFGDSEDRRPPRQKCKRDLARGRIMCLRYIRQQAAARRLLARKISMPEWTIRGDSETVLLAARQHRMLDGAFLQMIKHLIA